MAPNAFSFSRTFAFIRGHFVFSHHFARPACYDKRTLGGNLKTQRPEFRYWLLLFLIVTAFYSKLVFTNQFDWLWGPDLAQQVLPWFEDEARQLQHSQFPLWDTHSWNGQPLLGQAQPGAAYPLNWLLRLIPRQNGHILKEAW